MSDRRKPTCHRDEDRWHKPDAHRLDCVGHDCLGCVGCAEDHCGHRGCGNHVNSGEWVCPRCVGHVRADLQAIEDRAFDLLSEALESGVNSEAAMLIGAAANADQLVGRRIWQLRANAHASDGSDLEEWDMTHPFTCLTHWEYLLRDDLGHDAVTTSSSTISAARAYLAWVLIDLARSEDHVLVFDEFATDIHNCRTHIENSLRDSRRPELGAPCPSCADPKPRLRRRWAHWCEREDCEREHDKSGARDTWQCPRADAHWWSEADYRRWVSDDYLANADRLTAEQIAEQHGIPAGTVRRWANGWTDRTGARREPIIRKRGKDQRGRQLYDVGDALDARLATPA